MCEFLKSGAPDSVLITLTEVCILMSSIFSYAYVFFFSFFILTSVIRNYFLTFGSDLCIYKSVVQKDRS